MSLKAHSLVYFSIGVLFIALETMGIFWPGVFVKSLIIPALIWLYLAFNKEGSKLLQYSIVSALILSWAGDITLQLQSIDERFFLLGLVCFLMAQLVYLITFFRTPGAHIIFSKKWYYIPVVVLFGVVLVWYLADGLGDMQLPVMIYAGVILTMLLAALNREKKVNQQSFQFVLLGALFFVLSDSLIAINKFKLPFDGARIIIMSTYIMAQYLIVMGCLKQSNNIS